MAQEILPGMAVGALTCCVSSVYVRSQLYSSEAAKMGKWEKEEEASEGPNFSTARMILINLKYLLSTCDMF